MYISHISPRYLPSQLRGGEQYIRILCEQLANRDETNVLTSNSTNDRTGNLGIPGRHYLKEKTATINGVKVIRFPVLPLTSYALKIIERRFRSLFQDYIRYEPLDYLHIFGWGPFTPSMYSCITSSNYDFVHAAIWPTTTLFLSFYACKKARIPFVMTPFYHYRVREFTLSPIFRRVLRCSTAIIAATNRERIELQKIGAPPERTFVVPLALDVSSISPGNRSLFRQKYGLDGKFVVLTHPWAVKGGIDVLLALKQLSKNFSNLALVTFGNPDKEYLRVLSSITPLNFLLINLGWVYGQNKYDAYAASDVFAMPSISDAFGMVYLEAWASGKPILGAKNTAAADIIKHGQDGFLVERNDINDLKSKLSTFIQKPELADEMGQRGKKRVEQEFSPLKMSDLFKEALTKSLKLGLP